MRENELLALRDQIDGIDSQILELFEKRLDLVADVAEFKKDTGKPILDKAREEEKLSAISGKARDSFSEGGSRELFEHIMAICRKKQYQLMGAWEESGFVLVDQLPKPKSGIVYQGVEGAYSQMATKAYFGEEAEAISVETWRDAMIALQERKAEYAVLPIENSTAGFVHEIYDLLMEYDNYIVAEQLIKIEHSLLGIQNASLDGIKRVYSHPQALMQCRDFLDQHREWEQFPMENTAMAAKMIFEEGKVEQAAIASDLTAELYGLKILREKINDSADNSTRFFIIAPKKIYTKKAEDISICFELPHKRGSLYHMLSHIIYNDLNMTKITSRPLKGRPFEYRFFVDFEGNLQDGSVQNALRGIQEESKLLKILGNY